MRSISVKSNENINFIGQNHLWRLNHIGKIVIIIWSEMGIHKLKKYVI